MDESPTLGELSVGVEGLALLRLLYTAAPDVRAARLAETRELLQRLTDGELTSRVGVGYDIGDGYRQWAETYDRPLRLFWIEEPPMHQLLDQLAPGTVLDAACGTGRYAAYLDARGHTVIGVDQSAEMLDLARAKLPRSRFDVGDLARLPLDDDAVDAVVCALALVHVEDLNVPMREFARVVRPGGRIVISDVHPFLVALGWQAQFPAQGSTGFMRLRPHLPSDYWQAAHESGLTMRSYQEARLTADSVLTPTARLIPDANEAAYVGLPGVIIWAFEG